MDKEQNCSQTGIYHIRIKGNLNGKWADWFSEFEMSARESGETLLSGSEVDPAALHGALTKIHRLGLPLLLAVRADCPCTNKKCQRRGDCQACAAHYAANRGAPFCFREKNRWDKQCRSIYQIES